MNIKFRNINIIMRNVTHYINIYGKYVIKYPPGVTRNFENAALLLETFLKSAILGIGNGRFGLLGNTDSISDAFFFERGAGIFQSFGKRRYISKLKYSVIRLVSNVYYFL